MPDHADPTDTRWSRPAVLVATAYVLLVVLAYLGGQFWWYGDGDGLSFLWFFLLLLPWILAATFLESIVEETMLAAALPWVMLPLFLVSAGLNAWLLYRATKWASDRMHEPQSVPRLSLPPVPSRPRKWSLRVRGSSLEVVRRTEPEDTES